MSKEIENKINDALFNFYLEADNETIKDSVVNDVPSIEDYNAAKQKALNKIAFIAKATAAKQRNEYLLALVSKFQEAIEQNIEKPVAMLKQLIQGQSAFALNNNLNKLTKEEIIEIIKDKNLLELLEQLDKNENHD